MLGQAKLGQARLGQAKLGQAKLGQARLTFVVDLFNFSVFETHPKFLEQPNEKRFR